MSQNDDQTDDQNDDQSHDHVGEQQHTAHDGNGERSANQEQAGDKRRFGVVSIPISRLREQLILSSIVALLALTLFVLTLAWDQFLWMAAVALPLTIFSGFYALTCLRALRQADVTPG